MDTQRYADAAPDQDFVWFRDLRGKRGSVYRDAGALASLTGAVERIKDRNTRRMLGLYLGVWSGEPFGMDQLAERFGASVYEIRKRLAAGRREAAPMLGSVEGRIAESMWDIDGDPEYERYGQDDDVLEDDYSEDSLP